MTYNEEKKYTIELSGEDIDRLKKVAYRFDCTASFVIKQAIKLMETIQEYECEGPLIITNKENINISKDRIDIRGISIERLKDR